MESGQRFLFDRIESQGSQPAIVGGGHPAPDIFSCPAGTGLPLFQSTLMAADITSYFHLFLNPVLSCFEKSRSAPDSGLVRYKKIITKGIKFVHAARKRYMSTSYMSTPFEGAFTAFEGAWSNAYISSAIMIK
jgi:hypothetical protein